MPLPTGFEVKKGSNIFDWMVGGMPSPLSAIAMMTWSGLAWVVIVMTGAGCAGLKASMALLNMFIKT